MKLISRHFKTVIPLLFVSLLSGCSGGDWKCKTGKNANGETVQYAENTKTGEIGPYSKCQ